MKDITELGTGLPLGMVAELDDHNPTIEVDWSFIRLSLNAMNSLKKIAPDHIAEASIPIAQNYAKEMFNNLKENK